MIGVTLRISGTKCGTKTHSIFCYSRIQKSYKIGIKLFNRILKAFVDFYDGNYDFEIIWKVDW